MHALPPLSLFFGDERTIPFAAIACVCFYHRGLHFRVNIRLCLEHLGILIGIVVESSLGSPEALLLFVAVDD